MCLAEILTDPFMVTEEHGNFWAAEHLQLLLSFCHAKEHASLAADLLLSVMARLYTCQSPPVACVSIAAQLVHSAGKHSLHHQKCCSGHWCDHLRNLTCYLAVNAPSEIMR